jgi:hypothetical protein
MALGAEQELSIVVRLRDEATKQLNSLKGSVENMEPAFKKMAAVGTAAFVGITAVAYKGIQAYGEVERSQRQLEHAVIDVSKGTMDQVKAIEDVSNALEKKAGVDADALKMGAAQLSTFGLQSKSVVDLTKSLADFTVNQNGLNASSDQYVQSANTIAKALNGQFGILEKTGVRFTEAQQKMILHGTETEKVAALQEGLNQNLRETTDTVGGVDLATALLNRNMENLSENIGAALAPAFNTLMEKITPLVSKLVEWAEKNPDMVVKIMAVSAAVAALLVGVGLLGLALPPIIAGFALLISPVGIVIALLAVITAAIIYLAKNWQQHWDNIKWATGVAADWIKTKWDALQKSFLGFIQPIVDSFKTGVNFLIGLAEGWANGWVSAANTVIGALNKIKVSIPSWVPEIGGKSFGINIPTAPRVSLPRMEHGGIIGAPRGTEVPIIAHGGEEIIPAGRAGAGGGIFVQIEINNPSFRNKDDIPFLKDQLNKVLRDVMRNHKLQTI